MNYFIFPTQLFYTLKLDKKYNYYLIEEPRYFTDFKFNRIKLIYHRASMKCYYDHLISHHYNVEYIEYNDVEKLYKTIKEVTFIDPIDYKIKKKLKMKCNILPDIQFLLSEKEIIDNKDVFYKNGRYHNDLFYKFMRKKLNILMKDGKPIGKWSYDSENRNPLPKNIVVPDIKPIKENKYTKEAKEYIEKNFPNHYGELNHYYPIDRKGALKWLVQFFKERFKQFGNYEDAISEEPFLFHSVLTPMLNIGLLLDHEVVDKAIEYYEHHSIPIEDFEAFIRQVIGWRTYIYSIYRLEPEIINENQLNHHKKITKDWWKGIGIEPIDDLIQKINKYGYVHHIERLMVLGNWMLLNEIHPKEVYRIFMEWTVDAYDWVMVGNTVMTAYNSNKLMTRPYFSSSNYIIKMSHYKKGEWSKEWDKQYYRFIHKHSEMLSKNYSTAILVKHWNNKSKEEQKEILTI
jgi:deoxyribodipyrimidine photolyase-related protein